MAIYKNFFKVRDNTDKINIILFFYNLKKYKIKYYSYSSIYYKKIYKIIKCIFGVLCKYNYIKFNIVKIKLLLFNKKNKEYVIIHKYINLNNILSFFYK